MHDDINSGMHVQCMHDDIKCTHKMPGLTVRGTLEDAIMHCYLPEKYK
jgi:hypothetical protein